MKTTIKKHFVFFVPIRFSLILIAFILTVLNSFSQNVWTEKKELSTPTIWAVGFSIGTKGYIGTGNTGGQGTAKDFWEWEQTTNTWTQKADFGGIGRMNAVGFSIGNKGYIGIGMLDTGYSSFGSKDFWEWNQTTNTWSQKADFGGGERAFAVGFSIGTKGYIGTGSASNPNGLHKDFWEWDQTTNTWTQKADFGGEARNSAVGFSICAKGYIGTGSGANELLKDFWEWDQTTNKWTKKADFGGTERMGAVGFSIGNKGYIGTGTWYDTSYTVYDARDFWEWDQATNTWAQRTNFGGMSRYDAVGFSVGFKGYIGTGFNQSLGGGYFSDFWEYTPIAISINGTKKDTFLCKGDTIIITSSSKGTSYWWNTGQTTSSIVVSPETDTIYTVLISNGTCQWIDTINVAVYPKPIAKITGPSTFSCGKDSIVLTASGGNSYLWNTGNTTAFITIDKGGIYSVTVSNNSCTDSTKHLVSSCVIWETTIFGDTTICKGESTTLIAEKPCGISIWSTGDTTDTITVNPLITTTYFVKTDYNYPFCPLLTPPACICMKDSASVTVTVNSLSLAYAGEDTTIITGKEVQLNGSGGITYSWSPFSNLSCSNCPNPVANPNVTTTYVLTVTDNNGCANTDAVTITVIADSILSDTKKYLFVPNIFSPNGDNNNDILYVYGTGIETIILFIYGRWGEKVFETTDINKGWDGTFRGKPMNTDVFAYYLKGTFKDGEEFKRKGNITLIR